MGCEVGRYQARKLEMTGHVSALGVCQSSELVEIVRALRASRILGLMF